MEDDREIVSAEANYGKTHDISTDLNLEETAKNEDKKLQELQ